MLSNFFHERRPKSLELLIRHAVRAKVAGGRAPPLVDLLEQRPHHGRRRLRGQRDRVHRLRMLRPQVRGDAMRPLGRQQRLRECIVLDDRVAVGADRDAIIEDYALTESLLPAERSHRIAAYLRSQHPQAVHAVALATQSPAPVMRALLEQVDERWGSAAGYLRANGMTDQELEALRAALVEEVAEQG